ncbi:MAG: GAF domain-containing protein [Gammaproteobacteria bacterium]|nr:GAF domain-containing protein [Gammaproteobacteria bacterium]MCP5196725.1 GAF domain-containing protein [Gammaproteobacteria bacterium]
MHFNFATDSYTQYIRAWQVRMLPAQFPLDAVASLFSAPTLVLLVWNVIPHPVLLTWLALLETTVIIRLMIALAFRYRAGVVDDPLTVWAACYTWVSIATAVCWGGTVVLLAHLPLPAYDALIALILAGFLIGGMLSLTPALSAYLAYALPLSLPPIFWWLLQDDLIYVALGVGGFFYLLLAVGVAYRYQQTLAQARQLALENGELVRSFTAARKRAEKDHQQLAEQQAALQDSVDAMRELYRVISSSARCSQRMQSMLMMGCQRFGLAIGILARIKGDRYEIIQAQSPNGEMNPGDVFALDNTYCRDTLLQGPVGFEHAATGIQRDHPCYRKFKLEAYLGASVWVSGSVYGTLCFSDLQPRAKPFTMVDRELIQLMAQWVGSALEQEHMAAAAQRQQTLLAHASRLNTLGEMASGLVHEINQPITAIALYTEAGLTRLRSRTLEGNELREMLEKIAAQSARASAIIQQIRRFARQGKPQYVPVRIQDLLDEIADFLNLEAQRHTVRIRYDTPLELPPVLADALQIQQVILNLVRNAIDAVSSREEVGKIILSARLDQEIVEIAVQDTGPGLEPNIISQLLHPFFTTKPHGLGLGLPISQSIIEAHGGQLWVTPNSGPGVTFHFTLPVAKGADLPEYAPDVLSVETS